MIFVDDEGSKKNEGTDLDLFRFFLSMSLFVKKETIKRNLSQEK